MTSELPSERWWRLLHRRDQWALAVMTVLPLIVFAVPALAGHPAIAQDNLIQNFPLRVLTGAQLRGGHLPQLNPLANAGTPLLAGMNAGSFFPLTLLFVIPAPVAIWVVNLVATYVGAALGLFALLRWYRISTWAALVPALLYTYTGAMNGQMVHLGVIEGYALLPWYVLTMVVLEQRVRDWTRSAGWRTVVRGASAPVLGIAGLWALTTLSGEPRAIAEMELLGAVVMAAVLVASASKRTWTWRQAGWFLLANVVGISWGSLIGLAQLLPGWSFINISQRTGIGYDFFGAGSLPVRWTSLLLIPDLLGGNGILHQPSFFVSYNLPEVSGYVGLAALVALGAFLARRTRHGWPNDDRPFVLYVVIGVVGLFATWGYYTPLGHLFDALPLFGSTRLQSRNVILVDLAVVVLLGWWLERLSEHDVQRAGLAKRRLWLALFAPVAAAALAAAMLIDGAPVLRYLGASASASQLAQDQRPTLVAHLVVALALIVVVVGLSRRRRRARTGLHVVIAVDALLFFAFATTGLAAGHVNVMPSRASVIGRLGAEGRVAFVGAPGVDATLYDSLGSPNVNVFTGVASIQGYGSLIDSLYGRVTDTHPMFSLDDCQLADGSFRQLRLATLVVSADALSRALPFTPTAPSCLESRTSTRSSWYFGRVERVATVDVRVATSGATTFRARLLDVTGRPVGPVVVATGSSAVHFNFAGVGLASAGVVIRSVKSVNTTSVVVTSSSPSPTRRQLATPLQRAIAGAGWRLISMEGANTFLRATSVRPSAWLGSHVGTAKVISVRDTSWGDSWITVRASAPTVLKRSMEWIPGWRATATNVRTHRTITLHVVRSGLIQQVSVPRGTWTVYFYYHAPHIDVGLLGTAIGTTGWIGAVVIWGRTRRRGKMPA